MLKAVEAMAAGEGMHYNITMDERRLLYLAAVLDLFSRRVVDWSLASRMCNRLAVDALSIEMFYNSKRLHSTLGYVSPIHYENSF